MNDVPPVFPTVSVVLPVRNEAPFVRECLSAVRAQAFPGNLCEIIVVDGMSDDGTPEILQEIARTDPRLKVLKNPARIVPTSMNLGIREARGDVVVRVDGHAVIPPDYVRSCVEQLIKDGVDCAGGAIDSVGVNYAGSAIAVVMSSPFGVGGSGFRTATETRVAVPAETVPFGAFRRRVFERVGLFNEQMVRHQDYEFNYRLRQAGGKILLLPWLRAKYYVRSNLRSLCRQYWQYGIWKGRFLCSHPESVKLRHLVPPLFVGALVASGCIATFSRLGLLSVAALSAVYVAFLLVATTSLVLRGNERYAPVLPLIIAAIHFCWGAGVWAGLLRGKVPGQPPKLGRRPETQRET